MVREEVYCILFPDSALNDTLLLSTHAGLACFFAIVGFLLLTSIAVYYSPLLCGSTNEKKLLNRPQEIEDGEEYHIDLSYSPIYCNLLNVLFYSTGYSNNNFSTEVRSGPAHRI